jgi:DivIVA domain-containing protein
MGLTKAPHSPAFVILRGVSHEPPAGPGANERTPPRQRLPRSRGSASERARLARAVRDVDFPVALRGYDRDAVDRYVEEVNRVIAELEVSASPESAVRHALEEVTDETRGILERAHETAEEITARSRARADDRLQQGVREADQVRAQATREADETREAADREAKELRERAERDANELRETAEREVQQLRETAERLTQELRETTEREARELTDTAARESQHMRVTAERQVAEMQGRAEARVQELDRSAQRIWGERRRLIESLSSVVQELQGIAEAEAGRFPGPVEPVPDRPATAAARTKKPSEAPTGDDPAAPVEPDEPPHTSR